jgi:hypothetical protein
VLLFKSGWRGVDVRETWRRYAPYRTATLHARLRYNVYETT